MPAAQAHTKPPPLSSALPRTPFTDDDIAMIKGFGRVVFTPASSDKRFAKDMIRILETQPRSGLTDRQREGVQRFAHTYRLQMPRRK
jgi:hypothetical protein